jgi:tetratricopeptide (TPR) repeat protein
MLGLGVLLSAVGAQYEWIRLVFSTVGGFSVGYIPFDPDNASAAALVPQGVLFLLVVLAAAFAEVFGCARIRQALSGLALALLFYHLLYLGCVDAKWIETYVAQASSYKRQYDFQSVNFVPNDGGDILIRLNLLAEFEYIYPDRLLFLWQSLGRGWILGLGGALLIAAAPSRHSAAEKLSLTLFVCVPVSLVGLLFFGAPVLMGEYLHRLGDRQIAQGAFAPALSSYADAVAADPVLARSLSFMLKISRANFAIKGATDSYSLLYLADQDIRAKQHDSGFARLRILSSMDAGNSPFRGPYLRAAAKVERAGRVSSASLAYRAGDKVRAARDLQYALNIAVLVDPNPLDVHTMLARVELDMRQYSACISRGQQLLGADTISHKTTLADLKNTEGDCFAWMGDYRKAREAYFQSFDLDDRANYRAYMGLSGS